MTNQDVLTWDDETLIKEWYHYDFILSESVSLGDVYRHMAIEGELVRRGYNLTEERKIVKVEA